MDIQSRMRWEDDGGLVPPSSNVLRLRGQSLALTPAAKSTGIAEPVKIIGGDVSGCRSNDCLESKY